MKIKIIGSGGCTALPRPLCKCRVCKEAREKGIPYSRFGCSLYIEDIKLLIDTPEDIVHSLNYFDISEIHSVAFSHMDPDHTLGMRLFEHIRLNWLENSEGNKCKNPVNVFAMNHVMEDLNAICTKRGSFLDYYQNSMNLIKRTAVDDSINFENIKLTFVRVGISTVFVFGEGDKKFIYAPCDVKPFPENDIFNDADIMVIGDTIIGDVLKDGFILKENNPFNSGLFNINDIKELKNKYNIKKVIITHIEEEWGKSYDDCIELQKEYDNIYFAFDGQTIDL